MVSNMPPNILSGMIPGDEPEDEEVEIKMKFTKEEIILLRDFCNRGKQMSMYGRDLFHKCIKKIIIHRKLGYSMLNIVYMMQSVI